MSLYREYLDKKAELISKELAVKMAIDEWMEKQQLPLLQPVHVEPTLTMDNIRITSSKDFKSHIDEFEREFGLKCVRMFYSATVIPGEGNVKDYWKFHFKEDQKVREL